ncbi:MAG: hypothetical protein O9341_00990 [Paucibacter sp.]|nr:hypothetical protein [Roseateles sp.]
MMRLRELNGPDVTAEDYEITHEAWRWRAARVLLSASAGLTRLALLVHQVRAVRRRRPELEFYAEAGAPEGALYADGVRVGTLPGVRRL